MPLYAKQCQNGRIYRTMAYRSSAPAYAHPRWDDVYVKLLNYCFTHPDCTADELSKIGSADIWKTLVNYGKIGRKAVRLPGAKRDSYVFHITIDGEVLLDEARNTKDIFEFIHAVQDSKSKSLAEFDVNLTLAGDRTMVEGDYLNKIVRIYKSSDRSVSYEKRKLIQHLGVAFLDEIVKRVSELNMAA